MLVCLVHICYCIRVSLILVLDLDSWCDVAAAFVVCGEMDVGVFSEIC